MSHARHGVSDHRQLHCLFNHVFGRTLTKISKLRVTGFLPESTSDRYMPLLNASNMKIVSISWRHGGNWVVTWNDLHLVSSPFDVLQNCRRIYQMSMIEINWLIPHLNHVFASPLSWECQLFLWILIAAMSAFALGIWLLCSGSDLPSF